jgi:hypothetical protein
MLRAKDMVVEVARALGVLAIVFLSFVHHPMPASAQQIDSDSPVLTAGLDLSFCGDMPMGEDGRAHSPCHACRVLGAALPPPDGGWLALRTPVKIIDVAVLLVAPEIAVLPKPEARGPPRLA